MAQRRSASSGTNSTTKKRTTASKGTKRAAGRRKKASQFEFSPQIVMAVFLLFAVLMFISNLGVLGSFGDALSGIQFGLFGLLAYAFPLCVIVVCVLVYFRKKIDGALGYLLLGFVMFSDLCAFFQAVVLNKKNNSGLSAYNYCMNNKSGGGLWGDVLAGNLTGVIGSVGCWLVMIFVMVICLMVMTNTSIADVRDFIMRIVEEISDAVERERDYADFREDERARRNEERELRNSQNRERRQREALERAERKSKQGYSRNGVTRDTRIDNEPEAQPAQNDFENIQYLNDSLYETSNQPAVNNYDMSYDENGYYEDDYLDEGNYEDSYEGNYKGSYEGSYEDSYYEKAGSNIDSSSSDIGKGASVSQVFIDEGKYSGKSGEDNSNRKLFNKERSQKSKAVKEEPLETLTEDVADWLDMEPIEVDAENDFKQENGIAKAEIVLEDNEFNQTEDYTVELDESFLEPYDNASEDELSFEESFGTENLSVQEFDPTEVKAIEGLEVDLASNSIGTGKAAVKQKAYNEIDRHAEYNILPGIKKRAEAAVSISFDEPEEVYAENTGFYDDFEQSEVTSKVDYVTEAIEETYATGVTETIEEIEAVNEAEAFEEVYATGVAEAIEEIEAVNEAEAFEEAYATGVTETIEEIEAVNEAEAFEEAYATGVTETIEEIENVNEAEAFEETYATDVTEAIEEIENVNETEAFEEVYATGVAETIEEIEAVNEAEAFEEAYATGVAETIEEIEAVNEAEAIEEAYATDVTEAIEETEAVNDAETVEEAEAFDTQESKAKPEAVVSQSKVAKRIKPRYDSWDVPDVNDDTLLNIVKPSAKNNIGKYLKQAVSLIIDTFDDYDVMLSKVNEIIPENFEQKHIVIEFKIVRGNEAEINNTIIKNVKAELKLGRYDAGFIKNTVHPNASFGFAVRAGRLADFVEHTTIKRKVKLLINAFDVFGVKVAVRGYSKGPAVTRFEIVPKAGVKVSKILGLADDIQLALAAKGLRIEAPIPGESAVGIEIPNDVIEMVTIHEILSSKEFQDEKWNNKIAFAVGKLLKGFSFLDSDSVDDSGNDIGVPMNIDKRQLDVLCSDEDVNYYIKDSGEYIPYLVTDIAKMPHVLIAGTTGSGKSVCINTILMSLLFRYSPDEVKLIMIDPKVVELSVYGDEKIGVPHLILPVVTDTKQAAAALQWCVEEMDRRYQEFADAHVRNIQDFNDSIFKVNSVRNIDEYYQKKCDERDKSADEEELKELRYDEAQLIRRLNDNPDDVGCAKELENVREEIRTLKLLEKTPLAKIVVVVDELADLMMTAGKDVEASIGRIAQLARACGIHLIIATQRPSVDVITGVIKSNLPSRIAFSVRSNVDSKVVIDVGGAEKLLGNGDMLFLGPGLSRAGRMQGAFVSDAEVKNVIEYWEKQVDVQSYNESMAANSEIVKMHIQASADSKGNVNVRPEAANDSLAGADNDNDEFLIDAAMFIIEKNKASIGMLQRKFKIGFNRAARIMDTLAELGVVGEEENGNKGRKILLGKDQLENLIEQGEI